MKDDLGPQNNQGSSSVNTIVQGMMQALLRKSSGLPRLESMQKLDFVHLIS